MLTKRCVIILAGGSGTRMGGGLPKQFMLLDNKPILLHTVERFAKLANKPRLIVVVPSGQREMWKNICKEYFFNDSHLLVSGGITRFHSVKNALKYVDRDEFVAIHDGVRPFITTEFIETLFSDVEKHGAVVPAIKIADSLRTIDEGVSMPVERERYILVQTPQLFKAEYLIEAYSNAYSTKFTDDATVVESIGVKPIFVEGITTNIKITTPSDLILASAILASCE